MSIYTQDSVRLTRTPAYLKGSLCAATDKPSNNTLGRLVFSHPEAVAMAFVA